MFNIQLGKETYWTSKISLPSATWNKSIKACWGRLGQQLQYFWLAHSVTLYMGLNTPPAYCLTESTSSFRLYCRLWVMARCSILRSNAHAMERGEQGHLEGGRNMAGQQGGEKGSWWNCRKRGWRSVKRQRFGANTVRSGKGRNALDSRIDFCRTWSFTFYSNHSIIANGWTLSEQMAINLTGLIPFRYLSCVSASLAQAVFNLDWHKCTQGLLSLILPFFLYHFVLTCSMIYWLTYHPFEL